jgi:hypothetical protein
MPKAPAKNSDADFRRWLSQRLLVDNPLSPTDPLYEPIYQDDPANPVALIVNDIELSLVESLNFISGFRGCGKSTELARLADTLGSRGYFVIRANALDYMLPSEPVEISDFLIVLAGAFSDALEKDPKIKLDPLKESYWARFTHWLNETKVTLDGFDLRAGGSASPVGANLKVALKEAPTFRQSLRKKMEGRIGDLRDQVHKFFADGLALVKKEYKAGWNPVFIFDQFEQLRDNTNTAGRVAESIETLIANHRAELKIPFFHMVFTLPPWLKFRLPDLGSKSRLIYNVKLWENDPQRTPVASGLATMRRVVERRFTPDGLARFFGPLAADGSSPLADLLIAASGGHLRDLIIMLRETLLRTSQMPTTRLIIDASIANTRASFLPIPAKDAEWLQHIAEVRSDLLPDREPETLRRMTLLLDTHCALILLNGREWYDVHPIIREEIREIVRRHRSAAQP